MTPARPSPPLSEAQSSALSRERLLEACVLADRAALYRSVAKQAGHVLGNALQAIATLRAERAAGHATWDRLDAVARVLARVADDGAPSNPAPVVVQHVLAEADEWWRSRGDVAGAPVRFEFDPALPAAGGVASEIGQALLALIANAAEAAEGIAGAEVRVAAALAGDAVALSVTDNGPGIADEARERMFEPFYTTKDPERHLGLGLTVARHLLGRSGGEVRVGAAPGGTGTRAELRLPIWKRSAGA